MGARRRVLVALVPPPSIASGLRMLRSLVRAPGSERIPPHVTLVPPVNLPAGTVRELRRELREVAARTSPFELWLGPAASFAPDNPTVHLRVDGDEASFGALVELRERLRSGVLARPDRHRFVPHLTLRRGAGPELVDHLGEVLSGRVGPWQVDRFVLMEQVHRDGATWWDPVAEEPFGGPVVVGRGGVELHLRTVGVIEPLPAADEPEGEHGAEPAGRWSPAGRWPEPEHEALVVVAEQASLPGAVIGRVVGELQGPVAVLHDLEVLVEHRGQGVARQLLARWSTDAARAGALLALAPDTAGVLRHSGFTELGDLAVRQLRPWIPGSFQPGDRTRGT